MPTNPLNTPFRIGVRPLAPASWLLIDDRLSEYRERKSDLFESSFSEVYATTEGMLDSELEVLDSVRSWLREHAPAALLGFEETESRSALAQACLMINDDLAIMRHSATGWILASACICFPSLWTLRDKIGRVLADVHAPVPEFNVGSRHARIIEQMFDKLREGEPIVRYNYSIHDHNELHLPDSRDSRTIELTNVLQDFYFVRTERQTLSRMPISGDIVFTIDTSHRSASDLSIEEKRIIESQLAALSPKELAYKGLVLPLCR